MKDTFKTVVIFRYWRGDVIALFPEDVDDINGVFCSSYQSTGQHSGADYLEIIKDSRPATQEEYAGLKTELELTPRTYNFKVQKRATWRNHEKRHMAALGRT